jgi:DNA processing protein
LIKKGAKLCEGPEDILSEFEYLFPASPMRGPEAGLPALALSDQEQRLYDTLGQDEFHIDEIIRRSGLQASQVAVGLLGLEMKHIIRQLPGKLFLRANRM